MGASVPVLVALLFAVILSFLPAPAAAHLTPNSEIQLDFASDRVTADVVIPLNELDYALRRPLARDATGQLPPTEQHPLAAWLAPRIGATSPAGRAFAVTLTELRIGTDAGPPDVRFTATLTPPPGSSPRAFTLRYTPVIETVPGHFVLVLVRSDFAGGHVGHDPALLGGLRAGAMTMVIDRGAPSRWNGFRSAIGLGMHHIAEGHDHLLFLITLLLPAPLLALGRRWGGFGGAHYTLRGLVGVVTAFTLGHSVTLIGGAFFGWKLAAAPVESLIALSILVSALHGLRPLFPRREMLVAGGFGLVHGLAFATLVGHYGLAPLDKAVSILGFNLGIEIVQLAVVLCTMPALVLLAHTRFYGWIRIPGALFAAFAAGAWLLERVTGADNPVGRTIDAGLGYAPWLVAGLTVAAAVLYARRERNSSPSSLGEGDHAQHGGGDGGADAARAAPLHPAAPLRGPPPRA